MVNNIKDNTISEIDAKKRLNTLNKIKNAEIKYKRLIPKQKELLNLFNDLLDTILTDKTLMPSNEDDDYENKNKDDDYENENEDDDYKSENEDDDYYETISQNEKNETIKGKDDILDKIIVKSKSLEEQIKSLKKEKI